MLSCIQVLSTSPGLNEVMMALVAMVVLALADGARPPMLTYKQWSEKTGSTDRELYNAYDTKVRSFYDPKARTAVAPSAKPPPKNAADVASRTWESKLCRIRTSNL